MKVMALGDTHARLPWTVKAIEHAAALGVTEIWQVGDFGYWPKWSVGRAFLDGVQKTLEHYDLNLYFADGNHEDHDSLRHDATEPYSVWGQNERMFHVPRGVVRTFDQVRVMFVGGAVSVDRKWLTPGRNWFGAETINMHQEQRIFAAEPVDIVVAHDCPRWAKLHLTPQQWPAEDIALSDRHRELMTDFQAHLEPSLWLHGHYHQRATTLGPMSMPRTATVIEGLAEDGRPMEKATLLIEFDNDNIKAGDGAALATNFLARKFIEAGRNE